MGELFTALGRGLGGLERGLLLKHQLKEEAADRQIEAEDRALMMQDRTMQKREFELRMKQAGLALEQAQFNYDLSLAKGTPQEQAEREFAEEQRLIQQDIEQFAMEKEKHDAEIRSLDALAAYRSMGGAAGFRTEEDDTYLEGIKILDGMIKQHESALDDAELSGDRERAQAIREQLNELRNQREVLANSQLSQMGLLGPLAAATKQEGAPEEVADAATGPQTPIAALLGGASKQAGKAVSGIASRVVPDVAKVAATSPSDKDSALGNRLVADMLMQQIAPNPLGALFGYRNNPQSVFSTPIGTPMDIQSGPVNPDGRPPGVAPPKSIWEVLLGR